MKILHIFLTLAFLVQFAFAIAQPVTLVTPSMTVQPGSNVHLKVQVKNFQKITAIQFSLKWNKDVLQFIGVDNFGLPGLNTELNFGLLDASTKGEIRFSWVHGELTGVTLKDSSQMFSIWYKAVGKSNTSTPVSFASDPIVIEVINSAGIQPYGLENGTVKVVDTTVSTESITRDFILYQNTPNPFIESTNIRFDMKNSGVANLKIFDNSGREVFVREDYFQAGPNYIPLNREQFNSAGQYVFTLQTATGKATRQMIVQ